MRKLRRWLLLTALVFAGVIVLAGFLEPTGVVRAYVAGEPFYRNRPLRYWREVLRESGRQQTLPEETVKRFLWDKRAAVPILCECVRDPDGSVRWPAIKILASSDLRTEQIQSILIDALADTEPRARFYAAYALAWRGRMSRDAIPALRLLLQDDEAAIAHAADLALWKIDATAAADDYRRFHSAEFGFSVMLPGEPERSRNEMQGGRVVAHGFQQWHRTGAYQSPMRYVALVTEYADGLLAGTTEEERFQRMKDSAPFLTGGKVIEEKQASAGDCPGKEYLLELQELGRLRCRQFWIGDKQYAVMVAYQPQFLNEQAANYFIESFRIEARESKTSPKKLPESRKP